MLWFETSVLRWIEILAAISCLVQTFEFWKIRDTFQEHGVWKWSDIKNEFNFSRPLQDFFNFFLEDSHFLFILGCRFLSASMLLFFHQPVLVLILLFTSFLTSLRWRGTFNGGSDSMTVLVLAILALIRFFPNSPLLLKGGLWYLTLQTCLSYFISGWVKLKNKNWRNGKALPLILTTSNYEVPLAVQSWSKNKAISKTSSWMVMIFECSFPLALIDPHLCLAYLALALVFHLVNCYVFGLNRFLFAWMATYPAVYFCSLQLQLL